MVSSVADELFEKWNDYLHVAPPSDLPEVAYHYTTASGLFGILENKTIFATDKHFLNDKTEVRHGVESAISALESSIGKNGNGTEDKLLTLTIDQIRAESDERHFIFSLSEREDDLSQWRGYANEGDGFTIGFDTKYFRKESSPKEAPFGFNRVSYSASQFKSLVSRIRKDYADTSDLNLHIQNTAMCFGASVEAAACFYKHNSFRFEREWRVVSYIYPSDNDSISVRETKGRLIPYIEVPLCNGGEAPPIVEIGIGPSVQNPNIKSVIDDLCRRAGVKPRIYNANTPYVRY